nr:hypothetical protein [Tanacetum cinerariifolium]
PGSGISILLAVGTPSTGSGNLYCQWELFSWQWECLVHFIPNKGLSPCNGPNKSMCRRCKHLLMENDLLVLNVALWCFLFSQAEQFLSFEKVRERSPETMLYFERLFMVLKLR